MAKHSFAEMSAETQILISEISRMERGAVVTYDEHFTNWCGRPIRNRADIPTFDTVFNHLRDDYAIVLSNMPRVGYRVLTHDETRRDGSQVHRARRAARKRKKELGTVDISHLSNEGKCDWAAKMTQAHIMEDAASDKALKKIVSVASGSGQLLPLSTAYETLRQNLLKTNGSE